MDVWIENPRLVNPGRSISADVDPDKVALICQYMNYYWTDEGYLLYNYGVERTWAEENDYWCSRDGGNTKWFGSYYYDEEGVPQWTEAVTNTSIAGGNAEKYSKSYTMSNYVCGLEDNDRLLPTFSQNALEAVQTWTMEGEDQRYYPSAITLNPQDNDRVNLLTSDVTTYGAERILLMLDGQLEITDETWADYVENINKMGLAEIIEIYQKAYDEYIGK